LTPSAAALRLCSDEGRVHHGRGHPVDGVSSPRPRNRESRLGGTQPPVRDPARQRPASWDRSTNEHEADLGSSRYTNARLDRLGQDGSPRAQRRSKADLAEAEPARMKEVASVAAGQSRQARNDHRRGVEWRLLRPRCARRRRRHPRSELFTLVLGRRTSPRAPGANHDQQRDDDPGVGAHAPSSRRHIDRTRLRSRDKLGSRRRLVSVADRTIVDAGGRHERSSSWTSASRTT
jgi:hypothetical protein